MEVETSKLDCWAVVEVMGHKRYAGRVTEQAIGGASLIRVDVPTVRTMFSGREVILPDSRS